MYGDKVSRDVTGWPPRQTFPFHQPSSEFGLQSRRTVGVEPSACMHTNDPGTVQNGRGGKYFQPGIMKHPPKTTRPTGRADIVGKHAKSIKPPKRQKISQSNNRIRQIIDRQDQVPSRPDDAGNFFQADRYIAERLEVIDRGVGNHGIERVPPNGSRRTSAHTTAAPGWVELALRKVVIETSIPITTSARLRRKSHNPSFTASSNKSVFSILLTKDCPSQFTKSLVLTASLCVRQTRS